MALRKTIDYKGITVTNACMKIAQTTILQGNETIDFVLHYFAENSLLPFSSANFQCVYALNGYNPVKQGYEYLKGLPELEGAESF